MARLLAVLVLVVLIAVAARPAPGPPLPSALALTGGLHALAERELLPLPDPFPLRRVLLPPGAPLPIAPDTDPFRRMPREEFERRARAAAGNTPAQPKLIRAEYRATMTDDSIAGTGEWLVATDRPGAFALDPLRVAIHGAKWSDGRDARISGSPARLWLEGRGRATAAFAWSARGTEEPGAVRFNLGLPPAPLARLELELPADRVPAAKGGTLVAGPLPQPGGRAAWIFAFGGESTLEFAVRLPAAGRPPPTATFARTARLDLAPGLATLACDFEIASVRDPLANLEFQLDPGLVVSDVGAAGLAGWRTEGQRLALAFREPVAGGRIAIAAVAPLPADGQPWTLPNIHPASGTTNVDLIELVVGPDLKWEGRATGDYRVVRAAASERGLAWTLRGSLPAGPARRAPSVRVRGAEAEYATVETFEWRLEPDRTSLSARIRATVARGPLARLVVRVPTDARPFVAVVAPDDPTAALFPLGGRLWAIEPTQPISTGDTLDIRLELRGPVPAFANVEARAVLALDQPAPIGATARDVTTTLQLAPNLRGWMSQPAGEFSEAGTFTVKSPRDAAIQLALARRRGAEPEPQDHAPPRTPARDWQFADLEATATVEPGGPVRVEFTGRIVAAAASELAVTLPPDASLVTARVDGKWADLAIADNVARLPVPEPDADGVPFLMAYRLPVASGWFARVRDFRPALPDAAPIATKLRAGPDSRAWPTLEETVAEPARLVPDRGIRAFGFALAAGLVGFAIARARHGPAGPTLRVAAFLAVAGLGTAAWLVPAGWMAVIGPPLAVVFGGFLILTLKRARGLPVALALLPATLGLAQAPAPVTVYFLPASTDDPNRLTAWVPRSTLDRLTALAAPHLPAALVTDADYTGTESGGVARFEAVWRIDVTRAGPQAVDLPLSGVKLETMTLDDRPAFPDASKPGRYRITLNGIGAHRLKATFTVTAAPAAGDLEARFGIPDLPSTRVALVLADSGRTPELVGRVGARAVVRDGERSILKADLGPGGTLAVRWRDAAAVAPVATVLEATVWDVNETRAEARAAFLHRVERGAPSRLEFDLPPGLEAGLFTVREVDAPAGSANGLKDWILQPTPAGARLTLLLRQPARGTLATTFRLFPRDGATARPALVAPRAATGDVAASYLGVRLAGVVAREWQNQNLIDVPADAVAREFAAIPEFDYDRSLTRSLRREGPGPPVARPLLDGAPLPAPAGYDLIWTLGRHADAAGTVAWSGIATPAVECDLPPGIEVQDVVSADLAGWDRAGNRLRVWFKNDVRDPTLKWTGTWPAYLPAGTFELPVAAGATVRARPADCVVLAVENATAVKFQPTARPRERAFAADVLPPPRFRVDLPAAPAIQQGEALARTGNGFEHRVALNVPLDPKRAHAFTLAVANLPPGAECRIEWPTGANAVESAGSASRRVWSVEWPPTGEPVARIGVVTRFPVRPAPDLPIVELASENLPLLRAGWSIALPPDLRPVPGTARRTATAWTPIADGPIRLIDIPVPGVAEPRDTAPKQAETPAQPASGGRSHWRAAAWLLALLLVGAGLMRPASAWRPEYLFGYGLLATVVMGWAFATVAATGLFLRVAGIARAVGRRVIR